MPTASCKFLLRIQIARLSRTDVLCNRLVMYFRGIFFVGPQNQFPTNPVEEKFRQVELKLRKINETQ